MNSDLKPGSLVSDFLPDPGGRPTKGFVGLSVGRSVPLFLPQPAGGVLFSFLWCLVAWYEEKRQLPIDKGILKGILL